MKSCLTVRPKGYTFDRKEGCLVKSNKEPKQIETPKVTIEALPTNERMKYEIAMELGLYDKVLESGWKSLSAKETGRIGGLITKRKKVEALKKQQEAK